MKKEKFSEEINTLRGVSILFVLIGHSSLIKAIDDKNYHLLGDTSGRIGVYIFFIISGFCIINSLINIWEQNNLSIKIKNFSIFFTKRIIRLFPLYYLSIILALLFIDQELTIPDLLMNLTMLQSFFKFQSIQGLYWTLSFEIVFYMIMSIIYLTSILNRRLENILKFFPFIPLILATIGYFFSLNLKAYSIFLFSLFFFGCNFFFMKQDLKKIFLNLLIYFISLFFVLSLIVINKEEYVIYFVSNSVSILIFVILYLNNFKNKFFQFFGNISFSLYLIHDIIFHKLNFLNFNPFLQSILELSISVGITYFIFYFLEKKIVRMTKKINYIN